MLYYLGESFQLLDAFGSISVRAAVAALTAFLIVMLSLPAFSRYLRALRLGDKADKSHSDRLNTLHADKSGTPAMGGLLVTVAVLFTVVLCCRFLEMGVVVLVLATALLCGLGFVDDLSKARAPARGLSAKEGGLAARKKLLGQTAIGVIAGACLVLAAGSGFGSSLSPIGEARGAPVDGTPATAAAVDTPAASPAGAPRVMTGEDLTAVWFPFAKGFAIPLGALFCFWVALVIVATSNAVNLTDGQDGLAAGSALTVIGAYAAIAYVAGRADWSSYLGIPHVPGAGEVAVACAAMGGGWLGFLWHNTHPAEVFMGDSGSLPLGGAIGLVACLVKHELILPIIGAVFVAESVSVIIQVAWFRLTRRRIFRCAPLHHHFRFGGMPEPRVVVRFWIAGALAAIAGLLSLKMG